MCPSEMVSDLNVSFSELDIRHFVEAVKKRKLDVGLPFFETKTGFHTGPEVAGLADIKNSSMIYGG